MRKSDPNLIRAPDGASIVSMISAAATLVLIAVGVVA